MVEDMKQSNKKVIPYIEPVKDVRYWRIFKIRSGHDKMDA
jgi:hypothetical protein